MKRFLFGIFFLQSVCLYSFAYNENDGFLNLLAGVLSGRENGTIQSSKSIVGKIVVGYLYNDIQYTITQAFILSNNNDRRYNTCSIAHELDNENRLNKLSIFGQAKKTTIANVYKNKHVSNICVNFTDIHNSILQVDPRLFEVIHDIVHCKQPGQIISSPNHPDPNERFTIDHFTSDGEVRRVYPPPKTA